MAFHPSPFVLANSRHGTLILSYLDHSPTGENLRMAGVGLRLLLTGSLDEKEIATGRTLLDWRRAAYGDGCFAIDCGANIGVMTIEWSKHMQKWGNVLAFEMQRRVFYACAGNIAIHNCFNADVRWAAVGKLDGEVDAPVLDYTKPASIGSLGLIPQEDVGQAITRHEKVQALRLDSLGLARLDLLKIDVEGAELDVLAGAIETIKRCKPYIMAERLKSRGLQDVLAALGYASGVAEKNILAMPADDPNWAKIKMA
jgi:FkbM family methyltransferase